jgi:hypothetical protein
MEQSRHCLRLNAASCDLDFTVIWHNLAEVGFKDVNV